MKYWKKWGKWIVIAVVLLIIIFIVFGRKSESAGFKIVKIDRGNITSSVSATGTVNPVRSVEVGAQVSGRIVEVLVDYNSHVKKGQLIARIDPSTFEAELDQARGDLESARSSLLRNKSDLDNTEAALAGARGSLASNRAGLEESKANLIRAQAQLESAKASEIEAQKNAERYKELFKRKLVSEQDVDNYGTKYKVAVQNVSAAQADLKAAGYKKNAAEALLEEGSAGVAKAQASIRSAQALVESANAQLDQVQAAYRLAQTKLQYTNIIAPVDGIVILRNVDVGQTVAASFQTPVLFDIAQDLTMMQVEGDIDEADVGKISEGMTANFTVDAFPGVKFTGTITQVRNAPITIQNVVTYTAIIKVKNTGSRLKPGMTANIEIIVNKKDDVLRAPNSARRFIPKPEELADDKDINLIKEGKVPKDILWKPAGRNKVKPVDVKFGITDGSSTEIVSGDVKDGDKIVAGRGNGEKTNARGGGGFRIRSHL
ncbi:MAG: efflux RND transporter periplasmic adaptor subunit [Chloroflexi bacterium]|nr:efflux RND transporter periplasmic adaptor subunit [Chloroflexota bacterium]